MKNIITCKVPEIAHLQTFSELNFPKIKKVLQVISIYRHAIPFEQNDCRIATKISGDFPKLPYIDMSFQDGTIFPMSMFSKVNDTGVLHIFLKTGTICHTTYSVPLIFWGILSHFFCCFLYSFYLQILTHLHIDILKKYNTLYGKGAVLARLMQLYRGNCGA